MLGAPVIVQRLLEEDPPSSVPGRSPRDVAKDLVMWVGSEEMQGKITPENAMTVSRFYHRTRQYARGGPYEARRNGATKTWKTRPGEFRIPIKIGYRGHGYIDHTNAHEWATRPDFQ